MFPRTPRVRSLTTPFPVAMLMLVVLVMMTVLEVAADSPTGRCGAGFGGLRCDGTSVNRW